MKVRNLIISVMIYGIISCVFISATYYGSKAVSTVSQMIPLKREHTIIIDAGHGGEDGGATSCTGKLESSFNLEIALRLNDLLHLLGYQTVMVRTTDISVYTHGNSIAEKKVSDLKHRVQLVNDVEDGMLVSIHQNTFSESRYSGAQVFYGAKGESQPLATALQTTFCQTINPGSSRTCKPAEGIYLMEHIECTGILVECGFLSNPEEEAKLQTAVYQNNLCCVIASTVANFLDR